MNNQRKADGETNTRRYTLLNLEVELPDESALELFERFQDWPWPVLLHSADALSADSRWDIISAAPRSVLVIDARQHAGNVTNYTDGAALLAALRVELATLAQDRSVTQTSSELSVCTTRSRTSGMHDRDDCRRESDSGSANEEPPPFRWGALGYLGYEALHPSYGMSIQAERTTAVSSPAASPAEHSPDLPIAAFGVYRWSLCVDRLRNRAWLSAADSHDPIVASVLTCLARPRTRLRARPAECRSPTEAPPEPEYLDAFARIHAYLRAGDCYQVNLARRFRVPDRVHAWTLFKQLLPVQPGAFAGFMRTPCGAVLCFSPERLLRLRGRAIVSQPIKGTIARGTSAVDDQQQADKLRASTKDRAENLMITDLTRNDLGRVCRTGSVQVDQLFGLRALPAVFHLESTISGELRADVNALDALAACFPAGSITGAPKRRAMQIIREIELVGRSVYCGSLGYLNYNGDCDFNVAIRTLVSDQSAVYCWGGGGIVADSDAQAELQEIQHKVGSLLQATRSARPDESTAG